MTEMTVVEPMNREAWLTELAKQAMPLIRKRTGLAQEDRQILISCGFPATGGKVRKNGSFTSGQCFHTHGTDRKKFQIFIHPANTEPLEIAETVIHECLHALLPGGVGHKRPFSQAARKMGLLPKTAEESALGREGKPTETSMTKELAEALKPIIEKLGEYPHEKLQAYGKTQATRLLKVMCPSCGYVARITAKWLDEAGAPICPQCPDVPFEQAEAGSEAADPLVAVDQVIEYKIKAGIEAVHRARVAAKVAGREFRAPKFDERYSIRMHREGKQDPKWYVIDFGDDLLDPAPARLVPAEDRQDAIEMAESLRDGLVTLAELEPDTDDIDVDGGEDWGFDPEADWRDLQHLDDDEDEHPDYEDGDVDPEAEEAYALEQAKREGWVHGNTGRSKLGIEREPGSDQYRAVLPS